MAKFIKSIYNPKNPEKYIGTMPIICRSSWERRVCIYLDKNPSILQWASESVVIPYLSPIDSKIHRYFVDFAIKYKTRSGEIKKALIEVKPESQCNPPKMKNNKKRYLDEVVTYEVNQAKWKTAEAWCKERNLDFIVLTEKDLGIKK